MKTLPFNKEQIQRIIADYPTPFHIYDEKGIRDNARRLNEAFAWNEGFREYFAVKALPSPGVIQIMLDEGCGLDCSSYSELLIAKATGCTGDGIMFSSNATPACEFELCRELGGIVNLDDITHIDFLDQHGGIPDEICLRYNPGGEFRASNAVMGNPGDAKYGMTREQLSVALKMLKSRGVKRFGLHAFLASNTTDHEYYPALSGVLFETLVELTKESGLEPWFVNLSGGIGIPYMPDAEAADVFAIAEGVRRQYERVVAAAGLKAAIKTELGRYMTGPYGYLVATALHKKDIYKNYIGLDACAADLMRPAMYGSYHHITVMGKENAPCDMVYDITGSLCENNDKFAIDRPLPRIDLGDIVVIHDTGAHGHSMGYNYNGKLRSAEILLREDGTVKMVRRAETFRDLFATLDVSGYRLDG